MTKRKIPVLDHIEKNHPISSNTHAPFIHDIQRSLLLTLADLGYLNESQYRYAAGKLGITP